MIIMAIKKFIIKLYRAITDFFLFNSHSKTRLH